MTPEEAAEAHIAESLLLAEGMDWSSPEVAYSGPAAYAAAVRARTEPFLRSVEEYIGLSVEAARSLARERADVLCLHPRSGHRANLTSRRVHVLVEHGVITKSALDRPSWLAAVVPERMW